MENAFWLAQASTKCFPQAYGNQCELRLDMPVPEFCIWALETEQETIILEFQSNVAHISEYEKVQCHYRA